LDWGVPIVSSVGEHTPRAESFVDIDRHQNTHVYKRYLEEEQKETFKEAKLTYQLENGVEITDGEAVRVLAKAYLKD